MMDISGCEMCGRQSTSLTTFSLLIYLDDRKLMSIPLLIFLFSSLSSYSIVSCHSNVGVFHVLVTPAADADHIIIIRLRMLRVAHFTQPRRSPLSKIILEYPIYSSERRSSIERHRFSPDVSFHPSPLFYSRRRDFSRHFIREVSPWCSFKWDERDNPDRPQRLSPPDDYYEDDVDHDNGCNSVNCSEHWCGWLLLTLKKYYAFHHPMIFSPTPHFWWMKRRWKE